jgi:putative phosphoribosyl transferase
MNAVFSNRTEAGRKLAQQLTSYANHSQTIVLGLARGGVPIAYEIANYLNLPLDVCLVKKLGLPNYPETAMGAIAEDDLIDGYSSYLTVINENTAEDHNVDQVQIQAIAARVKAELRWREGCYRHHRPMLKITGRIVIVVDDGIATGLTMQAALNAIQSKQPQKIIVATPVALSKTLKYLETIADESICLITPKSLNAVGFWYTDFSQVSDQNVCNLLSKETTHTLAESC